MKNLILLILLSSRAYAATWYASPSATAGAGSIGDPWSIYTALTSGSAAAGDTIYLRGGTYVGPGFVCTLAGTAVNPITIRSYPGEWAVLTDGVIGTLGTTMNATTSPIVITDSEHFPVTQSVGIDDELIQLSATSGSATNWIVNRGWGGTTAASHTQGASVRLYATYILDHSSSSNVIFRDFEITSPLSTNRVFTINATFGAGLSISATDKAIGLIIHDTAQPGIGAFVGTNVGGYEINGCVMWMDGMFDTTAGFSEYRGSCIYAQNQGGGMAIVKNCIFFRAVTAGAKFFATTVPIRDVMFDGCISGWNGRSPLEIQSENESVSNTWVRGCYMLGQPFISYSSTYNQKQYFLGNTVVNGGLGLSEATNSTVATNTFLMRRSSGDGVTPVQYLSTLLSSNVLNLAWDYNTYVIGDGASPYQWAFISSEGQVHDNAGAGYLTFSGDNGHSWKAWTGLDVHSTCVTNWPTDYLRVQSFALDYDANRHFVGVVNTTPATSATLDLGANGFRAGDIYTLRDAQNYFTVIAQGVYSGSPLTLPLNLTTIATLQGSVTNFVPEHTNVQQPGLFNAFVLDRTDGGGSIAQLNVGTLIIR